ncbi:MAG TPA: tetratricopeptide repeat protein [Myxococcales bacterium]|nr:tetratricopeptide repeat protein [Myxococcales bacterium]
MRRLAMALLGLVVACAHAPSKVPPPDPTAERRRLLELPATILHKEARELMARGQWDAARARLDAFLTKAPESAEGWFDAGWLAERMGDPQAAADLYDKALGQDPANVPAALNLARLGSDDPRKAESIVRAALQKNPSDPRLLNALGAVLRAQRKLDEAEALARRVLERHPRDASAWRNLAAVESDRGHVRLAETALNNARKLDPKDAGIANSLGVLALRREEVAAARGWFEEATQLDADFAPAWANLGALALRYRDYALAEKVCARAVELDPARWEAHLALAWALEGLRRPREARAQYEKVLALRPQQDDALYGKALALKAEGDLQAALQAFREYSTLPNAARQREAQTQLAAIDLRLKSAPQGSQAVHKPAAGLDLSKLPQGEEPERSMDGPPSDPAPAAVR